MQRFWKRLPVVPSGYEFEDLLWAEMAPMASSFLDVLPRSVDQAWATVYGLKFVAIGLVKYEAASTELRRTPRHSTLHRVRERRVAMLERRQQDLSLVFLGALVEQARTKHPRASPGQLLMVVRDEFRARLREAFPRRD